MASKKKSVKKAPAPARKRRPPKPKPNPKPAPPPPPPPPPVAPAAGASSVLLVNMVPRSLSAETNQDSEPNIAVNPKNPNQIAGTAFTPDPFGGSLAPIYVSNDGGNTWALNSIVPSAMPGGDAITGDISIAFGKQGTAFYAGILAFPAPPQDTRLNILRTADVNGSNTMAILEDRNGVDQPFLNTAALKDGSGTFLDRVYVGDNDFASAGKTSTVDACLDAAAVRAKFKSIRVEQVGGAGQNGPQIRPTCHPDGTVYVAFYRWLTQTGDWQANTLVITADVIVVRDDSGASGATAFSDLQDTDGTAGKRVARGVSFPFHSSGANVPGQQRRGGDISIAVDPRNSSVVYLCWAAVNPTTGYTLHLRRSTDRGVTWSADDLRTISEALNPALAVNSAGKVGLLYQQLAGSGQSQRWVTHFRRSMDDTGANWDDIVLASVPANTPAATFDPYLGDYDHLVAVDSTFYGIFAANNTPDQANFPSGVVFQRNHDFNTRRLLDLNGNPVGISIDPFFFRVTDQ